jgi:hypothetical protein
MQGFPFATPVAPMSIDITDTAVTLALGSRMVRAGAMLSGTTRTRLHWAAESAQ